MIGHPLGIFICSQTVHSRYYREVIRQNGLRVRNKSMHKKMEQFILSCACACAYAIAWVVDSHNACVSTNTFLCGKHM